MFQRLFTMICLMALFGAASAQTVDIGRSVVTLPAEGEWIEIVQNSANQNYSGEVSGTTTAEIKTYLLRNSKQEWLALLTIRASKSSMSQGTMNWTGGCKQVGQSANFDFTNGSHSRLDCLRVFKMINAQAQLAHPDFKAVKAGLEAKNISVNGGAYAAIHLVGTPSGTFIHTHALISHNALKKVSGSNAGEAFAGQPGVAWGHLMAEQARSSANSWRGLMAVPSFE